MIKNLIHTLSSRLVISLLNLALLFITTKLMGAGNKGEISLFVLNISLAAIFSGLFGGPSLVYLIPRFPLRTLVLLNYTWAAITAFILMAIIHVGWLPSTLTGWDLFVLALMECLVAANTMILLGQEHVARHNFVQLIKVSTTVLLLIGMQLLDMSLGFDNFIEAYRIGLLIALLYSFFSIRQGQKTSSDHVSIRATMQAALKFGSLVQVGNIAQLLNYRLSFYFLELMIHPPGKALIRIGIYSAALQVAEAVWQFARSVSTVQYAKVSNLKNDNEGWRISLLLTKLNFIVTAIGVIFLALLPTEFYVRIFGVEFEEIRWLVIILAPGIIALSMSNAFSHFFAGIGLHKINTYSSVIGLVLTILVGFPSIKYFGTSGAAATATLAYVVQTVYQVAILMRKHHVILTDFLISKEDIDLLSSTIKRLRS